MVDRLDYVELRLLCADTCQALDQGTNGKKTGDLSKLVYDEMREIRFEPDYTRT